MTMATKRIRQSKLVEIVGRERVTSQKELAALLKVTGIQVTQSTLSRDIREVGLVKMRGRYCVSVDGRSALTAGSVRRAFQHLVMRSDVSGNILVIRTAPGNAHSIAVVMDAAQWPELLGTVAGDDTVFALLRDARLAKRVLKRIEEYLS
jgi:transcriptional regulator of arginine metabolism